MKRWEFYLPENCLDCGYDLTGHEAKPGFACPECGEPNIMTMDETLPWMGCLIPLGMIALLVSIAAWILI